MKYITKPEWTKALKRCTIYDGWCEFSFDNINLPCDCKKKFLVKLRRRKIRDSHRSEGET